MSFWMLWASQGLTLLAVLSLWREGERLKRRVVWLEEMAIGRLLKKAAPHDRLR